MTTQPTSSGAPSPRSIPPDPLVVFAAFMNPLSDERTRYAYWEHQRIMDMIYKLPPPQTPDSQAGRNERAKLTEILRQYEQKIRSIFADASRIMQLSDQYKINAACVLAEAQCKSKVIACRISMINDLPPEILSYILEIAATTPPTHLMYARKPLSQVCRRWRDIVIGNQYLWSALDFSNITPAEKISEYLRRAGSAKLQIRISDPVNGKMGPRDAVPGDFFTSQAMNSVMDFLIPKISQVAHLVLLIRSWYPLLVALERFYQASNAPDALERLEIHRIGMADEENVLQPWTGSEHAFKLFNGRLPSLRIFIMDAIQCDWERTHLHGIRLLDLRSLPPQLSPTLDQLRGILSRSPELQQLHVHALAEESFTDAFISSVDPLSFPRLLTLTLGNLSPSQATCISKLISAPGLIELNIRCARDRGEEYGSVFSILTRKFPSVRILQLTDFNAPPTLFNDASAVFTRFLFSMPNIELLRVGSIPSQFFTFFSSEALDAVQQLDLLPRWVLPKLLYIIADSISVDVLMEFIAIRRTMGLPLKRVFVVESWFNGAQVRQVQRDNLRGLVDVRLHPGYFVRPREEEGLWKEVML